MITLTDRAITHVKDFLANRGSGVGIRVGVRTAGCSGLAYVLELWTSQTTLMSVLIMTAWVCSLIQKALSIWTAYKWITLPKG